MKTVYVLIWKSETGTSQQHPVIATSKLIFAQNFQPKSAGKAVVVFARAEKLDGHRPLTTAAIGHHPNDTPAHDWWRLFCTLPKPLSARRLHCSVINTEGNAHVGKNRSGFSAASARSAIFHFLFEGKRATMQTIRQTVSPL